MIAVSMANRPDRRRAPVTFTGLSPRDLAKRESPQPSFNHPPRALGYRNSIYKEYYSAIMTRYHNRRVETRPPSDLAGDSRGNSPCRSAILMRATSPQTAGIFLSGCCSRNQENTAFMPSCTVCLAQVCFPRRFEDKSVETSGQFFAHRFLDFP